MKSLSEIREDLKEIRYYYSRKKYIEEGFKVVGTNNIIRFIYKSLYKRIYARSISRGVELYGRIHTSVKQTSFIVSARADSIGQLGFSNG